jgi:hypothetical protein
MSEYKLSCEIQIDADSPLKAAKIFEDMLKTNDNHFQFYVQDEYDEIVSVDLDENDEDAVLPVNPKDYEPLIK